MVTLSMAALSAMAQQSNRAATSPSAAERISEVDGKTVISSDNQKVGALNNFMLDFQSGRILYAVIGGTPNGPVAIAPQTFRANPIGPDNNLHLNVTKQQVDSAPRFTGNVNTPQGWGQASFVDSVYQHFGQQPWWKGATPAKQGSFINVHEGGNVLGAKLDNIHNRPIATIKDVIVNPHQGEIVYVVFQPDSNSNLGNNLYALPPSAIRWNSTQHGSVSNINKRKLMGAPRFASNNWPNQPVQPGPLFFFRGTLLHD